jgi:hypothetical protein
VESKRNETGIDGYPQNADFGSKPSHNTNGRLCKAKSISPSRFYSLDVPRGVAALRVMLWHWRHFFCDSTNKGPFPIEQEPMFELLYGHPEKYPLMAG